MNSETFEQIIESLIAILPVPSVFLGGIGEPLFHPAIVKWIVRLKELGSRVELITKCTKVLQAAERQPCSQTRDWYRFRRNEAEHF